MPGLGLGAGLNRRQQNLFNAAAQQGQGQQWLAAHPNIQQRTASNQAVQNFANTGQVGANAAQRFQPGGRLAPGTPAAPQGSGQTGSQKGGGNWDQQGGVGQVPGQAGQQQPMAFGSNSPAAQQALQAALQSAQQGGPIQQATATGTGGLAGAGQAINQFSPATQGAGNPNLFSQQQLANLYAPGQMANQAGMPSAQTGLQGQNMQQLVQMILSAFGGGGGTY